jgi:hypothetical protein
MLLTRDRYQTQNRKVNKNESGEPETPRSKKNKLIGHALSKDNVFSHACLTVDP